MLTIQGLDPIYTDFTVAETDLALVRRYLGGPNVKVQTDLSDDSIPPRLGDLYFIDNAVQPGSGTVKARAVTPNPDHALLAVGICARPFYSRHDQRRAARSVASGADQPEGARLFLW